MAAKSKNTKSTAKSRTSLRKSPRKSAPIQSSTTLYSEVNEPVKKSRKPVYRYLILFVFLGLLLSALYLLRGYFVAAMVNGRPITRLALIKQLEEASGKQALDSLVTKEMILQEARRKNVAVNNDEVSQELDKLSKQLEAEGTTLDAALAVRGMNRVSFEENLRVQKLVEKLLESDIKVSEEDAKKYYEENKSLMQEGVKYEDLKEDPILQLKQQKLDVEYEKLYNKLKTESDIKYFVTF